MDWAERPRRAEAMGGPAHQPSEKGQNRPFRHLSSKKSGASVSACGALSIYQVNILGDNNEHSFAIP
jgi:hypothetical protein